MGQMRVRRTGPWVKISCPFSWVQFNFFELTDTQEEMIRGIQQQIRACVPDLDERVRQREEALEQASQEQTM